jgi:D-beta-D-heptose 7-phosphate kinase/D-beta-D-heptose 1-phosphate adenosyltransferase
MTGSKILSQSRAAALATRLRRQRKKIVFTNGTFDLLHAGHVDYLQRAKKLGDVLVIGVNSDASVKKYKSPNRPLNPLRDRLRVLTALACVDYAVSFSDSTPLGLILKIRPDVLAKGADWKKEQIAGAREVESWGGRVERIRLVPGRSTTRLLKLLNFEK